MRIKKSIRERINSKVEVEPDPEGCLRWTAGCDDKGYARIKVSGIPKRVSRIVLSWKLGRGLADDEFALHTCHDPACVKEDHLYPGDQKQNVRDMDEAGRRNARSWVLSEDDVLVIRNSYAARTASQNHLAHRFQVSQTTISSIVRGMTHQNDPGPICEPSAGGRGLLPIVIRARSNRAA